MSRRKKRIAMLTFEYGPVRCGGLAAALSTLCRGIDRDRFEPVVVLPRSGRMIEGPPLERRRYAYCDVEIRHDGFAETWLLHNDVLDTTEIYPEPSGREGIKKIDEYAERVAELVPELDACLVHLHDAFGYKCLYAAARAGLPSVLTIHRLHDDEPTLAFAETAASKLVSVVTTVSRGYAADRADFFGGFPGMRALPNGIDLDFWREDAFPAARAERRARLLAEFGLPERETFAYVGRLDPDQKGIDILLEAHAAGLSEEPVNLIVVGDGDPALVARVASRAGKNLAFSHGHVAAARVREIFGAVDFAIVPSRYEPFGLAAVEAMAMGALPLVSRVGGLRDTVAELGAPGGFGWTFPPNDPGALVHAALSAASLSRERPERIEEARAAARRAASLCSARAMAEAYEALYDDLLVRPGAKRAREVSWAP